MFRKQYHYLIAGLPDFFLDDSEIGFSMPDFKLMLKENLTPEDYKLLEILFLPYDNDLLLAFLSNQDKKPHPLCKYTYTDFETELSDDRTGILPAYMYKFAEIYHDEDFSKSRKKSWENILTELYYEQALKTKNKFLSTWLEFNLNLNNLVTGYTCRKHNLEPDNQLIGDNFINQAILTNNSKDFGLGIELPYTSEIITQLEKDQFFAREKGLDQLKWNKLEEATLFNYFTIEVVLAYTIKLEMAYRWLKLDEETGRKMFRKIIEGLKSGFEFSNEFAINGKNK